MLLAEALVLRSDQQKKLKELGDRIDDNARVPKDAAPDEDPGALLEQAAAVADELTRMVERINRTNAATVADRATGRTISDLIAHRDHAQRMTQLYRDAAKAGTRPAGRRWLACDGDTPTAAVVDVAALQRQADEWAVRYRELDVRLQQINWATELME